MFVNRQVAPPQQDVPQSENILPSNDVSPRQAEMNDEEAGLRTPEVVASENDENRIHSIAICSDSREGQVRVRGTTTGDDDTIIVPDALLDGFLIPQR